MRATLVRTGPGDPWADLARNHRLGDSTRRERVLLASLVLLVIVPLLYGTWSAWRNGWIPYSDNAILGVRARDVFSSRSPLLGMPTSFPADVTGDVWHPGPMLFWWYAPGVRLFGALWGLLLSVALLHTVSVAGVAVVAYRRGGAWVAAGGVATAAAVAGLSGGSAVLFRPLNGIVPLLAFLLFLFLAWSVTCGDHALLPVLVLVGSLVVQAEIEYLGSVVVFTVLATGGLVLQYRRGVVSTAEARRAAVLSGLAVLVCWALPAFEALSNGGGNFLAILRLMYLPDLDLTGWSFARAALLSVPMIALVLFVPFSKGHLLPLGYLIGFVVAGALVWQVLAARRARDVTSMTLLVLGSVGLATGAFSVSRIPRAEGFDYSHVLLLVPLAAFFWFGLVVALVRWWHRSRPSPMRGTRRVLVLVATMALLGAVSTASSVILDEKVQMEPWIYEAVPSLDHQLEATVPRGTTVVMVSSGGRHYRALLNGLIGALEARGVRTQTETLANYWGSSRDYLIHGRSADAVLYVVPPDLRHLPPDVRLVASYRPRGWSDAGAARLSVSMAALIKDAASVELSGVGEERVAAVLYGRAPGLCLPELPSVSPCRDVSEFLEDPRRIADFDPAAVTLLYRDKDVAEPTLPSDLSEQMDRVFEGLPVDVYQGAVPAPSSP